MASFGERLRQFRQARGLSLDELASLTGISRAYLWKLEKKPEANPSLDRLQRLAEALGTMAGDLIPQGEADGGGEWPIPESLRRCQKEHGLSEEDINDLAKIRFRGGHPMTPDDWHLLYLQLQSLTQRSGQ